MKQESRRCWAGRRRGCEGVGGVSGTGVIRRLAMMMAVMQGFKLSLGRFGAFSLNNVKITQMIQGIPNIKVTLKV